MAFSIFNFQWPPVSNSQWLPNITFIFQVGECQGEDFVCKAAAVCKEYMARDPTNLSFTVLALTASD